MSKKFVVIYVSIVVVFSILWGLFVSKLFEAGRPWLQANDWAYFIGVPVIIVGSLVLGSYVIYPLAFRITRYLTVTKKSSNN